jgi:hypothetical protein
MSYYIKHKRRMKMKNRITVSGMIAIAMLPVLMAACDLEPPRSTESTPRRVEGGDYRETPKDDFSPESIMIVMGKEASMKPREYSVEDFPEVNINHVADLTTGTFSLVQRQLKAESSGEWDEELLERKECGMLVDIEEFRRILCLTIKPERAFREYVFEAVALLSRRGDIESAEPNFYVTPAASKFRAK